jgi:integrase/recombinase XerD
MTTNTQTPAGEIPPAGMIPLRRRRRPPFIYSDAEIAALMAQARTGIRQRLVAATYENLIGLLAATGLRISEAIKLDRSDVDWAQGVLLVRESKFNKSRYVPVHGSTLDALGHYARHRDRLCTHPRDVSFFVSLRGTRLYPCAVQQTFRRLCQKAGVGVDAPACAEAA